IGKEFWKSRPQTLAEVLSFASKIFQYVDGLPLISHQKTNLPLELDHLRWFMLPGDAESYLRSDLKKPRSSRPFVVKKFQKRDSNPFTQMFTFSKLSVPFEIQSASIPQDIMKGLKKIAAHNDRINNRLTKEECKLLSFSCQ
ncbi:unnamed protein product, partial [Allacma fusca]